MVTCPRCGAEQKGGTYVHFCRRCGSDLETGALDCAHCGKPVPPAADQVCPECRRSIFDPPAPRSTTAGPQIADWHVGQLLVVWVGVLFISGLAMVGAVAVTELRDVSVTLHNILLVVFFAIPILVLLSLLIVTWKWFEGRKK